jgi:hypothetical protein
VVESRFTAFPPHPSAAAACCCRPPLIGCIVNFSLPRVDAGDKNTDDAETGILSPESVFAEAVLELHSHIFVNYETMWCPKVKLSVRPDKVSVWLCDPPIRLHNHLYACLPSTPHSTRITDHCHLAVHGGSG